MPWCAFEEGRDLARDYLIGWFAASERPIRGGACDVPGRVPAVGCPISDVG